jgi:hypothetical protein
MWIYAIPDGPKYDSPPEQLLSVSHIARFGITSLECTPPGDRWGIWANVEDTKFNFWLFYGTQEETDRAFKGLDAWLRGGPMRLEGVVVDFPNTVRLSDFFPTSVKA